MENAHHKLIRSITQTFQLTALLSGTFDGYAYCQSKLYSCPVVCADDEKYCYPISFTAEGCSDWVRASKTLGFCLLHFLSLRVRVTWT